MIEKFEIEYKNELYIIHLKEDNYFYLVNKENPNKTIILKFRNNCFHTIEKKKN